jgi:hypothetical protein
METPTSEAGARAMVAYYAPLLQGARLPPYKQPAITLQCTPACHPDFAAMMRQLCAQLDLNNRTAVSDEVCRLFRYHRFHGTQKLYRAGLSGQDLFLSPDGHEAQFLAFAFHLCVLLGETLLALLGPDGYDAWFPWNNFNVVPARDDRGFSLWCTSLEHHVSPDGRPVFASAKHPTITIRGKTRRVAFAPHAIQRLAERAVAPRSYASLGDVFGLLDTSHYYEPVILHPRQDAFALFEECAPGYFSTGYAEQMLPTLDPAGAYVYRVGYCPVVDEGAFWVAKTVLVPGYTGTPEYEVLRQASFDPGVKEQLLERCAQHSYVMLYTTRDFDLLRWFHTHGVAQVKRRVGQRLV